MSEPVVVKCNASEIPTDVAGIREALEKAQVGDERALARLKTMLAHNPAALVKLSGGDMGEMLRNRIYSEGFANDNPLHREGVRTHIALMREQLLAGGNSFIEAIVVDALLTAWAQAQVTGMLVGTAATLKHRDYTDKRHDRAFRRMLAAAKTLANIRRVDVAGVLAAIQQNGETNNVNVAVKL